ncbi:MAG: hypothetical protein KGI75_05235 [Rhizobiaceae bacterium]|nr:hypothetical protein [Rhizobiaceae bacterium]
MQDQSEQASSKLTPAQITSALTQFAETLAWIARILEADQPLLAKAVAEASSAMGQLAPDVGHADRDVALEIIISSARLVVSMRRIVSQSPPKAHLH